MRRGRFFPRRMSPMGWPVAAARGIGPQRALIRANRLMEIGDFANAAQIYDHLARAAHDLGRPRQAAHLYLQAARALLFSGQLAAGSKIFLDGLKLLAGLAPWQQIEIIAQRAIAELTHSGYTQPAQEIARWLQDNRLASLDTSPQRPAASRPRLPTHCPACGAVMRPDEIEWLDDATAECAYCGSPVRGEI